MQRRPREAESGDRWTAAAGSTDVVLVEDDRDVRDVICQLLVTRGMAVRAFANVPQALGSITERLPDVVITDLALPGRHGDELAATLRMDRTTSHLVLIAMSGVIEPSWDVVRWFDAYLRKPADIELLAEIVESLRDSTLANRERRRRATSGY